MFCGDFESVDHLLFTCPIAKVVWGIIAICFNQQTRPSSCDQFWIWIDKVLPAGEKVAMLGVASICWANRKFRNRACFQKKNIKSPDDILFYAYALM
jgi:hypothetical protein